ncbi:MAG: DUF928 domain-containing protein [Xenococcus sp. (in: cyanobacteria)]
MRFFISLIVIPLVLISPIASVFPNTYKPSKRHEQQQTQSTTNRGCSQSVAQFQILAPSDHIGKTASMQPTFLFWFDEFPESPLKISLTQPLMAAPLWQEEVKIPEKGLFLLKVPEYLPLKDGDYVLTAEIPCSIQEDSSSFMRIAFRKVSLEEVDTSKSVAENGIWYDALIEAWKTSKTDFEQLLEQVGIVLPDEKFENF